MCSTTSGQGLQFGDWVSYSLCCRYIKEEDGVVILRKYNAATRINWCVLLLLSAMTSLASLSMVCIIHGLVLQKMVGRIIVEVMCKACVCVWGGGY